MYDFLAKWAEVFKRFVAKPCYSKYHDIINK